MAFGLDSVLPMEVKQRNLTSANREYAPPPSLCVVINDRSKAQQME